MEAWLNFKVILKNITGAAVYCAAAMDYLVAEVMEMSGDCCRENKRKRITPRHIAL